MKSGRTIQEVAKEIQRQSAAKEDYLVNTRCLQMEAWNKTPMLHMLGENGDDLLEPLAIQATTHRQIGTYLNIPHKYYERMLQEDAGLLAYNVNRWLQHGGPEQRMLRTMDGRARAFLSNRYRCIDNIDIARATLPIIEKMPDARYESCQITDDYMYIKVVNPRLTAEVVPGDIVQAGVAISNSETGLGAVCIQPLVFRLVCSNGMVVNDARTRRNHVGRVQNTDENFALYSPETLEAENRVFIQKIQDTVRAAVDEARFSVVLGKMKESKEAKLNVANIPSIVKLTSSNFGITEAESEGVFERLTQEQDYTLYGLANAVTRYSQDVESYERASKLEEIGYSVMTMSPELFRRINHVTSMAA
jgi:hypothetical protein